MTKSKYLLKAHEHYFQKIEKLKHRVRELKELLTEKEFREHEDVKFAARLRKATFDVIPADPDRMEYRLKGDLKKYRRYKQGLQRYRLFFSFSSSPPIILYLYVNDKKSLRKDGGKNDPYKIFAGHVKKGLFSHDPLDPKIQKWISKYDF